MAAIAAPWLGYVPWLALVILSLGYWSQAWKIHKHKEVRDLSILSYMCLAMGFSIMSWQAYREGSTIFLVKQIMTLIPVTLIVAQIWLHRDDRWHDDESPHCQSCDTELESGWLFCPQCGDERGAPYPIAPAEAVTAQPIISAPSGLPAQPQTRSKSATY